MNAFETSDYGQLPWGWAHASLGALAEYRNGAAFKPSDWMDSGRPIIRIQNLTDPSRSPVRTTKKVDPRLLIQNGDLLFSWSATLDAFVWRGEDAWLNQHIFKVESEDGVSKRFLFNLLRHSVQAIVNSEHIHGSTMQHINRGPFLAHRVWLPPEKEQERIADALDELLSDLDAGVTALKRVRDKLKLYRAAVLKAAVEGALTAEWRNQHLQTEPASDLLKRILAERHRRWEEEQLRKFKEKGREPPKNWKAKYKEPAAPDTTDLPPLPKSWCWATVDQLIREPLRNGHSAKTVTSGAGVPTFSLSAVTDGDFSDLNVKQTAADPEKVRNLWAEPDDIFVERSNTPELVGTTRRYNGEPRRAIFPDLLIRVRAAQLVPAVLVELALQSNRNRAFFQKSAQGISGSMPKIDQDIVARAAVPLPPTAEQQVIIDAVEDQLSVMDHLESDLETKLMTAQTLRQSILRHAFSGKLVPQDANDEPASELLKRIAAERDQRAREAAAAKRPNGHKSHRAAKPPGGKCARAATKVTDNGRIADR